LGSWVTKPFNRDALQFSSASLRECKCGGNSPSHLLLLLLLLHSTGNSLPALLLLLAWLLLLLLLMLQWRQLSGAS
jgi:hypothetical protein